MHKIKESKANVSGIILTIVLYAFCVHADLQLKKKKKKKKPIDVSDLGGALPVCWILIFQFNINNFISILI